MQQNPVADQLCKFALHRQPYQCLDGLGQAPVAPDVELALIFAVQHQGGDLADHPHHAQNVVGVGVGHNQIVDGCRVDARLLQLHQNAVAAARVHQQHVVALMQGETGVVAAQGHGVAGAQNSDLFHWSFPLLVCLLFYFPSRMKRQALSMASAAFLMGNI